MLVEDAVYEVLENSKNGRSIIATPSAAAMVALKLHAIHQPSRTDTAQDWSDVLALVRANHLSLDDTEFSAIVLRHGGEAAIEKIRTALASGN